MHNRRFNKVNRTVLILLMLVAAGSYCDSEPASSTNGNDWNNTEARQKYKRTALEICKTYSPRYLSLGIEVNTYYAKHPEDFPNFVSLYKEIYDEVKVQSPSTKVFVTFQLERMKGLGTAVGYSGQPQWEILKLFDGKLDIVAFTSYPEVEYPEPSDIPSDYYTEILTHLLPANLSGRKIAITETGWNSTVNILPASANSSAVQVAFISRFAAITDTMKTTGIEFVTWAFMHDFRDTGVYDPFRTIGLKTSGGSFKGSGASDPYQQWQTYKGFIGSNYSFGIGPVPKNFPGSSSSDWTDMYSQVDGLGTLFLAQTDWKDSLATAGGIPQYFTDINTVRSTLHYFSADIIYGIGFFNLATGEALITK